jgi:hypothetical protein
MQAVVPQQLRVKGQSRLTDHRPVVGTRPVRHDDEPALGCLMIEIALINV